MTPSLKEIQEKADEIQDQINEYADRKDMKVLLVCFTSLPDKGSVLFAAGENAGWIEEAFPSQGQLYAVHARS